MREKRERTCERCNGGQGRSEDKVTNSGGKRKTKKSRGSACAKLIRGRGPKKEELRLSVKFKNRKKRIAQSRQGIYWVRPFITIKRIWNLGTNDSWQLHEELKTFYEKKEKKTKKKKKKKKKKKEGVGKGRLR